MRYEKNKDLGWAIAFGSFLVFLLCAVISAAIEAAPTDLPQAVILAHANLGREFAHTLTSFMRYVAVAALVYGIVGVIAWPPGPS